VFEDFLDLIRINRLFKFFNDKEENEPAKNTSRFFKKKKLGYSRFLDLFKCVTLKII
jgi:hypothetical protein